MILIFVASNDKSKIDWKSLTEAKKRELYTEFVLHYLPKELGDAAVGNPITFLIMIIVGAVIAKASAVIAACASLIGTGFSAVNIIEGCKMITKVAEGYDSISDVNAAKVSAKDCARGIALLGVEIIPVLFGLIKRGFAKYNGKKIKVGETSRSLNETSGIKGNWNKALNSELEPNKIYKVDDYSYFTDEAGRVNKVSGELKLETKDRNVYQQGKSVDVKDGIKGDDQGGHIIARVFNGPGEQINYVPQTAKLNNGEWKSMEKKWKDALSEGKKVEVDIQIIYNSDKSTKRPLGFFVEYKIDGIEQSPIYHYN